MYPFIVACITSILVKSQNFQYDDESCGLIILDNIKG